MADRKIVASFELEVDDAKRNAEAVAKAFDQMGQSGSSQAQAITRQLDFTQAALDRVVRKTNEGRAITQSDLAAIVQNWNRAADAVEQYEKNVGKVPAEVSAAMDSQRAALARATAEVGRATDAVNDNAAAAKIAGDNWPGLGAAVEATGGKFGTAAGKVGLVGAAFKEGWDIGMKLNKMFGTDMKLWEEAIENFGKKGGIVIRAWADSLLELVNLTKEVWTPGEGYEDRVLGQYETFKKTVSQSADKVLHLDETLKKEKATAEASAAAAAANAEAQRNAAQAAEDLAKKKEDLAKKIREVTDELNKEKQALKDHETALIDAEHGVSSAASQHGYYARAVTQARDAIAAKQVQLDALREKYSETNPVVIQAREELGVLTQSLSTAETRYRETGEELKRFEDAQKKEIEAIRRAKEEQAANTTKLQEHVTELEKAKTTTTQATTATNNAATASNHAATATTSQGNAAAAAAPKLIAYRDELGHLHIRSENVAASTAKIATAVAQTGAGAETAKSKVREFGETVSHSIEKMERAATAAERLATAIERIRDVTPAATKALGDLNKAAEDAAGDEGG